MTAKERAALVVSWIKKQQENLYLGTLEINLVAEFEAAERAACNAATKRAEQAERERDALVKEASEYLAAARNCETLLAAADKRAAQAEASAVRWEKRANQAAGRAFEFRDAWKDADTDARRLAKIAKNVRLVSESENNLIEKYAK